MKNQYYKLRRACDVREREKDIIHGIFSFLFIAVLLAGCFLFMLIFGS